MYIAAIVLIGVAALSLCPKRSRPLIEVFGFAAALGMGITGTLLLWLSIVGMRPSRWTVLALAAAAIAVLRMRGLRIDCHAGRFAWWAAIPGALIAYLLVVVATASWALPLWETDAFVIWDFKAKVLAGEALLPRSEYFTDHALSFSHLDYPLLLPMLDAIGVSRLLSPLTYLALGAIVYSAARRAQAGAIPAATIAALLLGAPAVVRWAGAGVADPLVALFAAAAVAALLDRDDLPIAAACCAFLVMTKLEGMVLAGVVAAAMLLLHRLRLAIACVIAAIFLTMPWLVWSLGLPRTHENYAARVTPGDLMQSLHRTPTILQAFLQQFIDLRAWGILWLPPVVVAIGAWRAFRDSRVVAVWCILLAQMLAYFIAYLVTPWELAELIPMTIHRLLLQVAPIAALLIGLHWGSLSADRVA